MNQGLSFEKRVEALYKKLGKKQVSHNIVLTKKNARSQFDITYGSRKKYFVECKYKSKGKVPLSEVATFAAKLYLHDIPYKKGVVVTNSTYDKRSRQYA
ncbi:MAG: restriction endonuclease, partial [Nanoarchaeota archaeon]|nr:restriction endonuclease [Nanoarchaeota archaeon]